MAVKKILKKAQLGNIVKGVAKAFCDLFYEIKKGNFLHFQELINEIKEMDKKK